VVRKSNEDLIRRAELSDCDGILACLSAAFAPYKSRYTPAGYEDPVLTRETSLTRLQQMAVFVAVSQKGEIVGTIVCSTLSDGEGHLRGMAVRPEWQGLGVAEHLLERAESALRAQRCTRITLDTTEPLKRAVAFYERNGFRATGRVSDFFGMPLFEYEKRLTGRRKS
jgi:ribosomal protein S18 acetylase RimI-like enzyme